ncbi:hypothetical protein P3W45_000907 [Vairimorpha bombi]|jgi:hypothetical protein
MPEYLEIDQEMNVMTDFDMYYIISCINSCIESITSTEGVSDSYKIERMIILSFTFCLIFFSLLYFFYKSISACFIKKMNCSDKYNIIDEVEAVLVGKNGEIFHQKF